MSSSLNPTIMTTRMHLRNFDVLANLNDRTEKTTISDIGEP